MYNGDNLNIERLVTVSYNTRAQEKLEHDQIT